MSFKDIIGHNREIQALRNAVLSGRVAHAYLFSGPEGIGKRLIARAFASTLNCSAPSGAEPCGACRDCLSIEASTHPNVTEITPTNKEEVPSPDGLIRIARVRELQASLRLRVDRGRKVAIVDGAERLMEVAANAFLKTLEEPPADSVIILVTSRASDLLPTILSRCQRINLKPLSEEAVREHLAGAGVQDAAFLARLSGGSLSKALEASVGEVYEKRRQAVERLMAVRRDDTAAQLDLAYELSRRDDLTEVLDSLKIWLRDIIVDREGAPALMTAPDAASGAAALGATTGELLESYSLVERARYDITPPRYMNRLLAMETLVFGLAERGALA